VLGMDLKVRVVALVGKEWRYTSSSTGCIVVGELGDGEE
jgi:hypothetical protein